MPNGNGVFGAILWLLGGMGALSPAAGPISTIKLSEFRRLAESLSGFMSHWNKNSNLGNALISGS
ncbi:MAG: hypothetical protein QM757_39870 [Paludibaculum sp.]